MAGTMAMQQRAAAASQQLMKMAEVLEDTLDTEIKKMDNMDEDDLEQIRRKRLDQLKKSQKQKEDWLSNGHSKYEELYDQPSFFEASKKSNRLVIQFYESGNRQCELMDKLLTAIAAKHIETRFVKIEATKAPFLVKRLKISMIPTLALWKDGQTVGYIRGSTEGADTYNDKEMTESLLEWRLGRSEVIRYEGDLTKPPPEVASGAGGGQSKSILGLTELKQQQSKGIRGPTTNLYHLDSDEEDDW